MTSKANITLIENSSAGNPPKTFLDQTIEIRRVDKTFHRGVDGQLSYAKHPSTIIWYGGNASYFYRITNVLVATPDGAILIEAEVLRNFEQPHAIKGGMQFQVLI